jgi:putative tryptophan/tyrosine transport system substrate-binding protein
MFKVIFVFICNFMYPLATNAKSLVAITKIASHPSLDAIEKGVVDGLKAAGVDVEIRSDNAQGNMATAVQIAQKYAGLKPALIIPITTPSAQTVYQTASPENIPVVFAGVSDPVAAKLVDATSQTGKNVTGVSDLSPIAEQVELIKKLQPSLKKVGILYNPSEANSVALKELFQKEAAAKDIQVILFPCSTLIDLLPVSQKIRGQVEALYIPNDNTIISGLDVVLKNLPDLPIYAADPESVSRGCLASAAMDQYQIGIETGKLAARVLKGENPSTLPVVYPKETQVTLNKKGADKVKIEIPQSLKTTAQFRGD